MATRRDSQNRPLRLGITGANGLLARELVELLPTSFLASPGPPAVRHFALAAPAPDPAPLRKSSRRPAGPSAAAAPPEAPHQLAELAGEAVVLEPLTATSLEDLDAVFFTHNAAETLVWASRATAAGAVAVDLTSALRSASPANPLLLRVPHPAAQALAAVLPALAALGVSRTAATIFPPASERGLAGIEELRDQSLRLLAVQSLPTAVFGTQIAFNLCVALGPEASPSHADLLAAIAADLRALAAPAGFAMPALHVVQAPIFHAYFISLLAEWDASPAGEALIAALRAAPVAYCAPEEPQPGPVSTAGENGVQLGAPSPDPIRPGAFWVPLSADNLRLRAAAAMHLAARALGRL